MRRKIADFSICRRARAACARLGWAVLLARSGAKEQKELWYRSLQGTSALLCHYWGTGALLWLTTRALRRPAQASGFRQA